MDSDNSTADLPDPFDEDPELRLLVDTSDPDGHWRWLGEMDAGGYGVVTRDGYRWRAHRWVWGLQNGLTELPLDHLCRTRDCVNPGHLEPVTTAENNRRIPTWGGNRTHCAKGHEFTPENTIGRADGKRRCRQCHRDQEAQRRARRAADPER